MKYFRVSSVTIWLFMMSFFPVSTKAQDVKLTIPKTSIDQVLSSFVLSKYLSYGTTDLGGFVTYYSLKPKSAIITLGAGNSFSLNIVADFLANFDCKLFNFDYEVNDRNIILTGSISLLNLGSGYKIVFVPQFLSSSGNTLLDNVIGVSSSGIFQNYQK